MQRVIQAAGRVHRTPDDRGVILLLDQRFDEEPYVDCFPPHWRPEVSDDPIPRIRSFWARRAESV